MVTSFVFALQVPFIVNTTFFAIYFLFSVCKITSFHQILQSSFIWILVGFIYEKYHFISLFDFFVLFEC